VLAKLFKLNFYTVIVIYIVIIYADITMNLGLSSATHLYHHITKRANLIVQLIMVNITLLFECLKVL